MLSIYYTLNAMTNFGTYIRERREALRATDSSYSLRQVAARMGVQPSFLSKVERGKDSPPSEPISKKLVTAGGR